MLPYLRHRDDRDSKFVEDQRRDRDRRYGKLRTKRKVYEINSFRLKCEFMDIKEVKRNPELKQKIIEAGKRICSSQIKGGINKNYFVNIFNRKAKHVAFCTDKKNGQILSIALVENPGLGRNLSDEYASLVNYRGRPLNESKKVILHFDDQDNKYIVELRGAEIEVSVDDLKFDIYTTTQKYSNIAHLYIFCATGRYGLSFLNFVEDAVKNTFPNVRMLTLESLPSIHRSYFNKGFNYSNDDCSDKQLGLPRPEFQRDQNSGLVFMSKCIRDVSLQGPNSSVARQFGLGMGKPIPK